MTTDEAVLSIQRQFHTYQRSSSSPRTPPHTRIDVRSRRCLLKPLTYILHHAAIQPGNGWAAPLPTQTGLHRAVLTVALHSSHPLCPAGPHTLQPGGGQLLCDTLLRTACQGDSFPMGSLGPGSAPGMHLPLPGCLGRGGQKSSCFPSSIQMQAGAMTKGCDLGSECGGLSKLAWRWT